MPKRARLELIEKVVPGPPDPADIDRLGSLRARIDEHEMRISEEVAEEAALTKKLLAHYESAPANLPQIADGSYYLLKLGMCAEQKQPLDAAAKAKVLKWLGRETFLALSNITFELLKGALTPAQFKELVTEKRTGRRTIDVVPKTAHAEAA